MIIEELILKKGEKHAEVLRAVDSIIRDIHPSISTGLKYGLPFYIAKKNICYVDVQKGEPLVGFFYGNELSDVLELLDFEGRKQVGHFSLVDLDESRFEALIHILHSALLLDSNK